MIPIILMLVMCALLGVKLSKPYDLAEFIYYAVLGLVTALIPIMIYLAIQLDANIIEPVEQLTGTETLVNISDTSYPGVNGLIRGRLFYLYGSVATDNSQAFNYYVKLEDGSYKLKSAPASDSTIVYTDGTPKVESTNYVCERGKDIVEPWSIASCKEKPTTYKFYIPEGSIAEGFKLGE